MISNKNFVQKTEEAIEIAAAGYKSDLRHYLRSLLALLLQAKNEPVTFQLLHDLIVDAFKSDPVDFDPSWLEVTNPEHELFDDDDEYLTDLSKEEQFDIAVRMIQFLIADYHRMKEAGLLDQKPSILYFGIDSPTGWRWYNFHPLNFVEQGLRGHQSEICPEPERNWAEWRTLAFIVIDGSIYE